MAGGVGAHRRGCRRQPRQRRARGHRHAGTFIHSEDRVVATIGIENLVIVDTPDAVLVAHRDHLQRVKEVVGELKARGHDSYKLHKTVARPWGTYTVLEDGPGFKIKRIEVKPGGSLSLQLHHRRSEHWVVVRGTARVTSGESVFDLPHGESTFIPVETMHRLENRGSRVLAIIEVLRRLHRGRRHRPLRRQVRPRQGLSARVALLRDVREQPVEIGVRLPLVALGEIIGAEEARPAPQHAQERGEPAVVVARRSAPRTRAAADRRCG